MPVTIPYVVQTWTDGSGGGTPVSAARLGVIEQGVSDAHRMPTVRAKRSTTLSITTSTWTLITFDGEDYDTDTMHDTVTNTDRLTCKHAGKFAWAFGIQGDAGTTGIRVVQCQKNSEALPAAASSGIIQGGVYQSAPSSGVTGYWTAGGQVDLAVNDYLALVIFQSQGSSITLGTDSWFAMTRIAT